MSSQDQYTNKGYQQSKQESMSNSASLASPSSPSVIWMDRELLKACSNGDLTLFNHLIDANAGILLSTTPYKNNCLHIAAMLGHDEFAKVVWSKAPSLFSGTNIDGETPLIAALMAANLSLASDIITAASRYMQHDNLEEGRPFNRMLLKVDRRGENVLHHAMRNGLDNLALQLLDIEPQLSQQEINNGESPMYMAARRGYSRVVERLLQIPSSANCESNYESAMNAAVRFDHTGIVKQLLEGRPQLAYIKDKNGFNPLQTAILENNLQLVKIFLEFDPNLAYIKDERTGDTLFIMAARGGFVPIAKVITRASPDSVYTPGRNGSSALHQAIVHGNPDFVNYILTTPQLHRFINQANDQGSFPLHEAADRCRPKLLWSLLSHGGLDYTAVNSRYQDAVDIVLTKMSLLDWNWNESITLMANVIPSRFRNINIDDITKNREKHTIKDVRSHVQKYISNTSLVATLLATITFAAAFTLPGGLSSDPADAGLPIFARKAAFQVFLISDTIAMCSSISVAFLSILSTWGDIDFMLNYIKTTKALMWCAYVAAAVAFGTSLFTVVAPKHLWLAIFILVLCTMLPLVPNIISRWPQVIFRCKIRGFRKGLIPNT